jgi:hypothetical protein
VIDQPTASTQVVDDDGTASISAAPGHRHRGAPGTSKVLSFTVVRSTSVGATSVDWALDGMDAADLGGTLPPAPAIRRWRNHRLIEITLSGDRTIEADETLSVILSNPGANLNLGTDRASTTVINDDGTFSITADQARVYEGDQGGTRLLTYTVTRSNAVAPTR